MVFGFARVIRYKMQIRSKTTMFEWILENKQWLFSGIGVAILWTIGRILSKKGLWKRIPIVSWVSPISLITPYEILYSGNYVTELKRHEIYRHFIGLKICWVLNLKSVTREPEKGKWLTLQFVSRENMANEIPVSCVVPYSLYTDINSKSNGGVVQVVGRVRKISPELIELSHVEIFY